MSAPITMLLSRSQCLKLKNTSIQCIQSYRQLSNSNRYHTKYNWKYLSTLGASVVSCGLLYNIFKTSKNYDNNKSFSSENFAKYLPNKLTVYAEALSDTNNPEKTERPKSLDIPNFPVSRKVSLICKLVFVKSRVKTVVYQLSLIKF